MRQSLIRASEDIAGLSSFIYSQSKKFADQNPSLPGKNEKDSHNDLTKSSARVSRGGSFPSRKRSIVIDGLYKE
jgi:hypothetical protein